MSDIAQITTVSLYQNLCYSDSLMNNATPQALSTSLILQHLILPISFAVLHLSSYSISSTANSILLVPLSPLKHLYIYSILLYNLENFYAIPLTHPI
jgi:hypothetical protein